MSNIIAFSYKYKLDEVTIEDIQNVSLFVISTFSLFACLYYNLGLLLYGNSLGNSLGNEFMQPLNMLIPVVALHAFIDFFLTKSYDLKVHHLCILGIYFYNNYCNVSLEYSFLFLYPLIKTEISSIFYVLKCWLPKKTILYEINTILFYLSFVKLRIYDFYYEIIYNNVSFDIVFEKYSQSDHFVSCILLLSCYGLYILNLYWFLVINKILYKTITKIVNININTDILCHILCSYLHWINIPLSYYIYTYNPNEKYIIDLIGISTLTISSYYYHFDIYSRLYDKKIEEYSIPNKNNIILFLNHSIAVNVRSFLFILTNYYNSQHLFFALFLSGLCNISSTYNCVINILELLVDYNQNKDSFLIRHNIVSSISIICDVVLIFINSPNEIAIPFLLINIMIGLLFIVEPFYKLTPATFHILLIAQTYYTCLSNSK